MISINFFIFFYCYHINSHNSILSIYITVVFAISRFIRFMVVNSSMRIMFEQLPVVS